MKHKPMQSLVFEPKWAEFEGVDKRHPLKYGEVVLFLGDMVDVPGHVAVIRYSGETVLMCHPEDFRRATEDEL
jgi:hypothetical protein